MKMDWSEPLVEIEKLPSLIGDALRMGKTEEAREHIGRMLNAVSGLLVLLADPQPKHDPWGQPYYEDKP